MMHGKMKTRAPAQTAVTAQADSISDIAGRRLCAQLYLTDKAY